MSYGFKYAGIDLSPTVTVLDYGYIEPVTKLAAMPLLFGDGAKVTGGDSIGPRREQWRCLLRGNTDEALEQVRILLANLFRPAGAPKKLELPHMAKAIHSSLTECYSMAQVDGPINFRYIGAHAYEFDIPWLMADPYYYGDLSSTSGIAMSTPTAISNVGPAVATPVYTLSGSGIVGGTVQNLTTGKTVSWANPGGFAHVRFDAARDVVETSPDGTTWTTSMAGVPVNQDPSDLVLVTGSNSIQATATGTATLTVAFRPRG